MDLDYRDFKNRSVHIYDRTTISKTVKWIKAVANASAKNPKLCRVAQRLKKEADPLKAVFDYAYSNVVYRSDPDELQIIRFPERSLRDRVGNCVDYAVLVAALLKCMDLGIPIKLRVVSWRGKRNWQHIYVLLGNWGVYTIFDPVIGQRQNGEDTFNNRDGGHYDTELKFRRRRDYFL